MNILPYFLVMIDCVRECFNIFGSVMLILTQVITTLFIKNAYFGLFELKFTDKFFIWTVVHIVVVVTIFSLDLMSSNMSPQSPFEIKCFVTLSAFKFFCLVMCFQVDIKNFITQFSRKVFGMHNFHVLSQSLSTITNFVTFFAFDFTMSIGVTFMNFQHLFLDFSYPSLRFFFPFF